MHHRRKVRERNPARNQSEEIQRAVGEAVQRMQLDLTAARLKLAAMTRARDELAARLQSGTGTRRGGTRSASRAEK